MAKKIVVLDAGHGGKSAGAVNGKYYEKTAALAIAKKVGAKLKERGFEVRYTRTKDVYFTLAERCRMANKWNADAFVSIHLNAAANKEAHGAETWRYEKVGAHTRKLADNVQAELVGVTGAKNRGVKTTTAFYVLKHTKMSALLVECGFISNDEECAKLFDGKYQDKIAEGIARGVAMSF